MERYWPILVFHRKGTSQSVEILPIKDVTVSIVVHRRHRRKSGFGLDILFYLLYRRDIFFALYVLVATSSYSWPLITDFTFFLCLSSPLYYTAPRAYRSVPPFQTSSELVTFSLSLRRLVHGGGSERESFHLYPEGRPLTKLPYSWNSNF